MSNSIAVVTNETLRNCIYIIRGQKVMLDFDLARIYGYTTKDFNRQVKNNIQKFPDDFMFLSSDTEMENLRCKNFTSSWGGKRYAPHAFTEQGIYMLMTVLKGALAVRQSIALVRLFKQMKDYIADNAALVSKGEFSQLEGRVKDVESGLKKVIDNFQQPENYKHILFWNGEKFDADVAYTKIYKTAKKSVIVIDDYIGLKTLELLRCVKKGVKIEIYSDNKAGRDKLTKNIYDDFKLQYANLEITLGVVNNLVHDRYIVIDYKTANEKLYHCGASSKDAGKKVTTVMQVENPKDYHRLVDGLKNNKELVLK